MAFSMCLSDHVFYGLLDGLPRHGHRQHPATPPGSRQPGYGRLRLPEGAQRPSHPHRPPLRRRRVPLLHRLVVRQLSAR